MKQDTLVSRQKVSHVRGKVVESLVDNEIKTANAKTPLTRRGTRM